MHIVLTADDLRQLSRGARDELLALALGQDTREAPAPAVAAENPEYQGFNMNDVVDLSFRQMQRWMAAASDQTKQGLHVFATRGPIVQAKTLTQAGITNLPHFQSRTTIRTRTVTGNRDAYLLGWDDWGRVEEGEGRYAVTPTTYRSLRRYFGL